MRLAVIINPASGQPEPVLHTLHDVLPPAITWSVDITQVQGDGTRLAEAALTQGIDMVAVYGGDGTVAEVTQALRGSGVPMALLPGGTGNSLALALRIPLDIREAAQLIVEQPQIQAIDVGVSGGRAFVIAAATGIVAETMHRTDPQMKAQMGLPAYFVAGLQVLAEHEPVRYTLTINDEQIEAEGVSVLIANSGSVATPDMAYPPGIDLQDGLLDVVVLERSDINTLLTVVTQVVGLQEMLPDALHWQVEEVTLDADPPQKITYDGDIVGETPLTAHIDPGSLRVVTP